MQIKTLQISFDDLSIQRRETAKLRAYIAGLHPECTMLHNHNPDGSTIYKYPVVQYKVINEVPFVIGLNEGCESLEKFIFDIEKIKIEKDELFINEKRIIRKYQNFGCCDDIYTYNFINPWFALNSENYKKYLCSNDIEKMKILDKIIIGNIISISKNFGYVVSKEIVCRANVIPLEIRIKDKVMLGFKGEFVTNFWLPDYIGIGKMVSRGFGTILKK